MFKLSRNTEFYQMETPVFPRFYVGADARMRVGEKAKELGIRKALIVTDKAIVNLGILEPVIESLKASDINYAIFDECLPDPPDWSVDNAGAMYHAENCDGVIGIGGGSSMDSAKGVCCLAVNPSPIRNYFGPEAAPESFDFPPLITIPTTSGTGAELTNTGVMLDTVENFKGGINFVMPTFAFIDPSVTLNMPLTPSMHCAFDALAHVMESVICVVKEPMAEAMAEKAVRILGEYIPKLKENPNDMETREKLAFAATCGGVAMNAGMGGLTHAVGHALGAILKVVHGESCAVAMPQLLQLYANWLPEETRAFGKYMGFEVDDNASDDEIGLSLKKQMQEFLKANGIRTLKQMGFTKEQCYECIPNMVKDYTNTLGALYLSEEQFKEIIDDCYEQ